MIYNNTDKVLRELFNNPTYKFHIRELARVTKLNPNTIINVVKVLEKKGFVKKETKKHIVEVILNLENIKTIYNKRIFNLQQIYDSGITDFLIKFYTPTSISLIGSYSRGEDIEKSDIDIVIITEKREKVSLVKFEKILKKQIHLLLIKKENISDEFFNNLINGVVLSGVIKK